MERLKLKFSKLFLKSTIIVLISVFSLSTTASAKKIVIVDQPQTIKTSALIDETIPSIVETARTPITRTVEPQNISSYIYFNTVNSTSSSTRSSEDCEAILKTVLSKIPQEQYYLLSQVDMLFDKSAKRGGGNANYISIRCTDISEEELKAVFVHELGHVADGSYLRGSSEKKSSFTDLGNPVKVDDPSVSYYSLSWKNDTTKNTGSKTSDFCSSYGATEPYEDFAECYIYYILQPSQFEKNAENNAVLKKKYDFISSVVFKGQKIINTSIVYRLSQVYDNTKLPHTL